jgi:hypothetical protein
MFLDRKKMPPPPA